MISNWTLPFRGIKPEVGRMLIVQEQPSIDKLINAEFYVFYLKLWQVYPMNRNLNKELKIKILL
jgi:hypothetical protein